MGAARGQGLRGAVDGVIDAAFDRRASAFFAARGYRLGAGRRDRHFTLVYEGDDAAHGRRVAVKLLHSTDEGVQQNFRREIEVLKALQASSCAPRLLDSGALDEIPYHVCAWVEGGSVDLLLTGAPTALPAALAVGLAAARATGELHRRGVIHRDISPDHMFLQPGSAAILIDFGMARWIHEEKPWAARAYARYDVLALGLLLCELLLGRSLFGYRDPAALRTEVASAIDEVRAARFPDPIVSLLERALAAESEMQIGFRATGDPFGGIEELEAALAQALTCWSDPDEAWVDVAPGVRWQTAD